MKRVLTAAVLAAALLLGLSGQAEAASTLSGVTVFNDFTYSASDVVSVGGTVALKNGTSNAKTISRTMTVSLHRFIDGTGGVYCNDGVHGDTHAVSTDGSCELATWAVETFVVSHRVKPHKSYAYPISASYVWGSVDVAHYPGSILAQWCLIRTGYSHPCDHTTSGNDGLPTWSWTTLAVTK